MCVGYANKNDKSVLTMLTEDRICNTKVYISLCLFIDTNIARQKIRNPTA